MEAKTLYSLLKPHLDLMEPGEKKTLSNLISGIRERNFSRCNRRISLKKAKEKLGYFHKSEIESCRNNINEASAKNEGIA